jgi:hypothetical protein
MTKIEKQEVQQIISLYSNCYNDIEFLEKQIVKLLDDKNMLVKRLNDIRDSETALIKDLQSKYGYEAVLDLEKLKISNETN